MCLSVHTVGRHSIYYHDMFSGFIYGLLLKPKFRLKNIFISRLYLHRVVEVGRDKKYHTVQSLQISG